MENERLTRDGTAEPVSRHHILRRKRGQGNVNFPCSADHEQDWQRYQLIYTPLYVMTMHTYILRPPTNPTSDQRRPDRGAPLALESYSAPTDMPEIPLSFTTTARHPRLLRYGCTPSPMRQRDALCCLAKTAGCAFTRAPINARVST